MTVGVLTTVKVCDLSLLAHIGINRDEIDHRQPIIVSVFLIFRSDIILDIDSTVDYRKVVTIAERLAENHIPLIETFAYRLASKCIEFPIVNEVSVKIEKPFALPRGKAGVEIHFKRADYK
ncbi:MULTISPECIES: dihydroneopterin aldolase [unclassified Sphingopyxis]|jgi:dihydroneopterin aldolase|uniref:dihydroneopterin aldolase n=1 Tax=unclassified Sphingopyxis TaxID=2614943 RepID=UPI0009E79B9A|nr:MULTISPECIES: dihydroneopterin aldolase [unclassified Sphingopyxis]